MLYSEKVLYSKKLFYIQRKLLYLLKFFLFTEMFLQSEKILIFLENVDIQRKSVYSGKTINLKIIQDSRVALSIFDIHKEV